MELTQMKYLLILTLIILSACGADENKLYSIMNNHCPNCKIVLKEVTRSHSTNSIKSASITSKANDSLFVIVSYDDNGYTITKTEIVNEIIVPKSFLNK